MTILHYSLGLPPYRTGGMTQYCLDLISEEQRQGREVALLWPGSFCYFRKKSTIKKMPMFNYQGRLIENYQIKNPLPIPLLNGVRDIDKYTEERPQNNYRVFLLNHGITVVHFHTLMGLPIEFLNECKKLRIETIYTSHDFFGICPRVNLCKSGHDCNSANTFEYCFSCSKSAFSFCKIVLMQSPFYRVSKNTNITAHIRAMVRAKEMGQTAEAVAETNHIEEYKRLQKFYFNYFISFDVLHFNSSRTREVFSRYLPESDRWVTIPLSLPNLDKKNPKTTNIKNFIRFGFVGNFSSEKGYFNLINAFLSLKSSSERKYELNVIGNPPKNYGFIKSNPPFKRDDLASFYNRCDVIVVPSVCNETFGFTLLEGLSFNKPIITTVFVGSSCFIRNGENGFLYNGSVNELSNLIQSLLDNPEKVNEMSRTIKNTMYVGGFDEHCKKILYLYDGYRKER